MKNAQNTQTFSVGQPREDKSFIPSVVGCVGLVVAVAALTFVGTASAVNALNRNAANQIAVLQQPQQTIVHNKNSQSEPTGQPSTNGESPESEILSQLDWAKSYGVTWDEGGNPIDKNGNVMNDPTTTVNEVARAIANGSATKDGVSVYYLGNTPAVESVPVKAPAAMYENVKGVSQTSDGTYVYTVQSGDCLTQISASVGVDLPKLMDLNGIKNANVLSVGQQLVLPSGETVHNASGVGLG